jgi:hypothetical protein
MKTQFRLGALALLAIVPMAACEQGSPTDVPAPRAILTQNGAVPTVEEVDLCKVGPAGSYNFSVSINPGPGLDGDATDGDVDVDAGTCERIAFAGGLPDDVTVTENVPAGFQLDSIIVQQLTSGVVTTTKLTGTNTAVGVMGGIPASGAVLTFYNSLIPGGGEGCTPGYWRQDQHFDSYPAPYTSDMLFVDAFGVDAFPGMTLAQVAALGGGGLNALGRHAVAALLNAASPGVDYDLTEAQVISAFAAAFASGDYETQKDIFEGFNEQGCPLN